MGMLERNVQVRKDAALGHQRQHLVHVRVGVDVMQAHPGPVRLGQQGQPLAQVHQPRLDGLAVPEAGTVLDVHPVSAGVLADDEQLLDTRVEQRPRLIEHITNGARHEVAAHAGDDAEGATVVAAFADLEVRVVPWGELDAGHASRLGHQIDERIVGLGHVQMHRVHHLLGGVRAGDGQHLGVHFTNQVAATVPGFGAQAARDDDTPVLRQGFADGVQALLDRIVNEPAGVDDDQVGSREGLAGLVALGAQLGQDQFGIRQRLRAAQRNKADARCRAWRLKRLWVGHLLVSGASAASRQRARLLKAGRGAFPEIRACLQTNPQSCAAVVPASAQTTNRIAPGTGSSGSASSWATDPAASGSRPRG